jgi:hypothetical protein
MFKLCSQPHKSKYTQIRMDTTEVAKEPLRLSKATCHDIRCLRMDMGPRRKPLRLSKPKQKKLSLVRVTAHTTKEKRRKQMFSELCSQPRRSKCTQIQMDTTETCGGPLRLSKATCHDIRCLRMDMGPRRKPLRLSKPKQKKLSLVRVTAHTTKEKRRKQMFSELCSQPRRSKCTQIQMDTTETCGGPLRLSKATCHDIRCLRMDMGPRRKPLRLSKPKQKNFRWSE